MMLICSMTIDFFSRIKFLGHPLTFMMVYLWARDPENYHIRMNFFGVITFSAPYLPWVLLIFSLVLGNPIEMDLMGIVVGHTYYFLDTVYPQVAAVRDWSLKRIMVTPSILHYIFATDPGFQIIDADVRCHLCTLLCIALPVLCSMHCTPKLQVGCVNLLYTIYIFFLITDFECCCRQSQ